MEEHGSNVSNTVRVVKVSLPNLEIWEYVRADITKAPADLPLGAYDVSF